MTLNEDIPFDLLIWEPDVLGFLREEFPHREDSTVITLVEATRKKKLRERQPTPIDWLISRRDAVLVSLAEKWIESDDERTPSQFVQTIWNPLLEAVLDRNFNGQEGEEFAQRVIPIEISATPPRTISPLANGLIACVYSMVTLEAGDVESTVDQLDVAVYYLGFFNGANREQAVEATPYSAFGRRGANKRNEENREMKAEALAHYAANKHKPEYKTKNKAAAMMAGKVVPVAYQTVRDWLSKLPTEA